MIQAQLKYPSTKKVDQIDDYHGTKVADPYRWLEDDNSADTKAWVTAENSVTFDYLSKIPYRNGFKKRIEELSNYAKFSSPQKKGEWFYFYKIAFFYRVFFNFVWVCQRKMNLTIISV